MGFWIKIFTLHHVSAMALQRLHQNVFFQPVDMAVGENVLGIYIYGLICSDVTLWLCETVVRGLQGVSETTASLSHFKVNALLQLVVRAFAAEFFGIEIIVVCW